MLNLLDIEPKTTIYHKLPLKNLDGDECDLLLMIPGNPGLIEFYMTYLDLIQEQFPYMEILGISHAGFSGSAISEKTYDLSFQISHKYDIVKKFILDKYASAGKKTNLYTLAHSMGCYVYQRALWEILHDKELDGKVTVKFSGLITPTILDIAQSPSGTKVNFMINWNIPFIWFALLLCSFLNLILSEEAMQNVVALRLIPRRKRKALGVENSIVGGVKLLKSKEIINQALTLASEEMKEINSDHKINDWYFHHLSDKKWVFFANKDRWIGNKTREYLIQQYGNGSGQKFEICNNKSEPIMHNFCVSQSEEFADITVNRIKALCESD
ncbi:uncharacterized protein SPAPADRAFT_54487 [Spathaspora passalidarum NRRL Y-27907]|uniref:Lipid droplet-associated hydrolase n=1 Tax=Spathaspora passalidarum (strain NRRL Y-27907 / 11-Y1) TaxID=619300 RepID=G3AI21_SPAPN|nr:uncharacterized protein SPAPADRAFT_54487 [Spathaspora passalidarum NRRL Y-27907]EGW34335.1 hypothetical protein SPAPADRAFT_54487 [Spathaspora passalidarum NRRL Y-27907]